MFHIPNPFKKNDGFKLDEYSIPSMGSNDNKGSVGDDLGSNSLGTSGDSIGLGSSGLDENNVSSNDNLGSNSTDESSYSSGIGSGGLGGDLNVSSDYPPKNDFGMNTEEPQQNSVDIHSEISKVKIDAIDAKVSLMEARMYSIEQKLDTLLKLVETEISDQTKKKIRIDNVLNSLEERKNRGF